MGKITMGNFFSGSGTWELAAKLFGIDVVFESEIEPFPVALEAKRFPEAIQLGDISKVDGTKIPPVDILTNSSPCQDLSVAGLRKGMQHTDKGDEETTRSGLFMEVIRITKEMRDEQIRNGFPVESLRPRFWLWENVPGALSSGTPKGEDFRIALESVARLVEADANIPMPPKGWANAGVVDLEHGQIAWRIIDAQYEVPQRRRRIFLVASFGSRSAESVLFEREGLPWNFKEVADSWEDTSRSLGERISVASRIVCRGLSTEETGMDGEVKKKNAN